MSQVTEKTVLDTTGAGTNYKYILAKYGTASPAVCGKMVRNYDIAAETGSYNENFYLDMMVARCSIYFQGGEYEAQLTRMLDADKLVMLLHQHLTKINQD